MSATETRVYKTLLPSSAMVGGPLETPYNWENNINYVCNILKG